MGAGPTIYDVARHCGVAASTVSRALGDPSRVSARTREAVLASVVAVGYVPPPLARATPPRRARTLLLVVSDIANPYYAPLIKAAQTRATRHGHTLALTDSDESPRREELVLRRLLGTCGGAVLATSRLSDTVIGELARHRPLVMVNRVVDGLPAVLADTATGMRDAVRHLADLGHREIVYLSGPANSWINSARWSAVREQAAALGLRATPLGPFPPTRDGGHRAARALTGCPAPPSGGTHRPGAAAPGFPTAAIAYNDLVALGTIEELSALGRTVPDRISVIGCDDILAADLTGLTTVSGPTGELGAAAVDTLRARLTGAAATAAPRLFPTHLLHRATTAPPPAA